MSKTANGKDPNELGAATKNGNGHELRLQWGATEFDGNGMNGQGNGANEQYCR